MRPVATASRSATAPSYLTSSARAMSHWPSERPSRSPAQAAVGRAPDLGRGVDLEALAAPLPQPTPSLGVSRLEQAAGPARDEPVAADSTTRTVLGNVRA